jgi:hypothetical protein
MASPPTWASYLFLGNAEFLCEYIVLCSYRHVVVILLYRSALFDAPRHAKGVAFYLG